MRYLLQLPPIRQLVLIGANTFEMLVFRNLKGYGLLDIIVLAVANSESSSEKSGSLVVMSLYEKSQIRKRGCQKH